jgi:hypothetical protein
MRPLAVIPSRYEPNRLASLLGTVASEADVLVLDNGHRPRLVANDTPTIRVEDARGMGIYAMWNLGRSWARDRGYHDVAILNDDIRILSGTLSVMARVLRSTDGTAVVYPDWTARLVDGLPRRPRTTATRGTRSVNGMTGYCFMVRGELDLPPFDEGFHWWYGDDAFERGVRELGHTVRRIDGLPIEHESDSEANGWARRPELRDLAELDRQRWERLSA